MVRFTMQSKLLIQGRRRHFESGTAIERRRRSPNVEGTSGGEHERGYVPLSLGGFGGSPPRLNFCN